MIYDDHFEKRGINYKADMTLIFNLIRIQTKSIKD